VAEDGGRYESERSGAPQDDGESARDVCAAPCDDQKPSRADDALGGDDSRTHLRIRELVPVALAVLLVAVLALPRLPAGICYNDAGGLQLAAATLGITHPPGYVGYVSVAHLFTYVPGFEPAYAVSLLCLICGLGVVALCALMQIRLGVNAWLAAAMAIWLTADHRIWAGLIAPEVYLPSLAFTAAAGFLLMEHVRTGRNRWLHLAALVLGFAAANRPPVVFVVPYFILAWWLGRRRHSPAGSLALRRLLIVLALGVAPSLYSAAYLWVRDRPETRGNYLDQYNAEFGTLPSAASGPAAKLRRVVWHMSGEQFQSNLVQRSRDVWNRLRWLGTEVAPSRTAVGIEIALLLGGAAITWRRNRTTCSVVVGLLLSSLTYICIYRVYGLAADITSLIFAGVILLGVVLSTLLPRRAVGRRRVAAVSLFVVSAVATVVDVYDGYGPLRPGSISLPMRRAWNGDATDFVERLDMPSLPRDAVICSTWDWSPPLWYAQYVLTKRADIAVLNARPEHWPRLVAPYGDRPIFAVRKTGDWPDEAWEPHGHIWRLKR